jgi:DNA-binding PadR family transcriptional regulator
MAQATPSPLNDLTSFQRDLLAVVAGMDDPCGLDVKEEIEAVYGSKINHGRLYPNMDQLVEKGLIQKEKADRRTNAYSITARGNRELAAHQAWTEQAMEGEA